MLEPSTHVLLVREKGRKYRAAAIEEIFGVACALLEQRLIGHQAMQSPQTVKDYCTVRLGRLEHEVFAVIFLDAQHRVMAFEEMFRGTLTQTSVYPREVVKQALVRNAAAVILVHNHPSGGTEPSRADEFLTQTLKAALALVDIRVLDHMIVGGSGVSSLAERGLI